MAGQQGRYDVVVIGAGPGGYPAAIRAAQNGLRVACVEREALGGVCLNWGCIPSKAIIQAATLCDKARNKGAEMGIEIPNVAVDMAQLTDWKDGIVRKLTGGVGQLLKGNGVTVVRGTARLASANAVEVQTDDGVQTLETAHVVVACGTEVVSLPDLPTDGEWVLNVRGLLDVRSLPRRLAIVGGGVIGMEMGMAYARLGSEVTVIEFLDEILSGVDRDCVKWVERRFKKLGGRVMTRSKAAGFELQAGEVHLRVTAREGGDETTVVCDKVLVAVGFRPNVAPLGLEPLGVALDERGHVRVDEQLRTSVPNIFAIGDVTGPPYLAHRATKQGIVAADVIAGKHAAMDVRAMPAAIFTDPEIAEVGLSEQAAREQGYEPKIARFPFAALGRALIYGDKPVPGLVKLVVDRPSGLLLGAAICGPNASDAINELAVAIEMGALAEDLALTVHVHPTIPEAIM
ncbi:MAG: dihydrolipoyl dehydrogenase, partial [Planctomycetota bacterium]